MYYYIGFVTTLSFAASFAQAQQNNFNCTKPLSPEDVLCGTTDLARLRCYEERALQYYRQDPVVSPFGQSGWWNQVCIFQPPSRIDNFTKLYSCNVTGDLGPVNCTPYDKSYDGFVVNCNFTFYFCSLLNAFECLTNFPSELEDGGKCEAEDDWCPSENLYSLTAFVIPEDGRAVFDDLTHLNIRLPKHCEPVNTLQITFLAIGVAGIFIGIIYSLFKLKKCLERTKIDEQDPIVVWVKKILGDPRLSPEHAEQAECNETAHPIDLASSNRHNSDPSTEFNALFVSSRIPDDDNENFHLGNDYTGEEGEAEHRNWSTTNRSETPNHRPNVRYVNADDQSPKITFVSTIRPSVGDQPAIDNPTYVATDSSERFVADYNMHSPLLPSYVNSEPRISVENGDQSSNLSIPPGYLRKTDIDPDQD